MFGSSYGPSNDIEGLTPPAPGTLLTIISRIGLTGLKNSGIINYRKT